MNSKGKVSIAGSLQTKVRRYRLFSLRLPFGRLWVTRDRGESYATTMPIMTNLHVDIYRKGALVESRDLGSGLVTNAGVNLLAADWTNATATLKLMQYHDSGTGTTAAAVTDTALQTPTGLARVAGTQSNASNVYTTTATITYTGGGNITEWGLFSASAGGTMWDRKVFSALVLDINDEIQYTYSVTFGSGG